MSEADRLFEELGYEKKENGLHNVARYKKDDDNVIYFCEATKYSEADVHKSGEYCETCYGITMQELKAITKKCLELRMDRGVIICLTKTQLDFALLCC